MAEFGDLIGDTVDFQSDARINDLYRQQEGMLRAKGAAEAKAKMFADDTRYQNAMNPFDHKRVKEYAQKKTYELGEFQRQNPNWRIDPILRAEYQNRVDDIKSNEYSINGMASDQNLKALTGDLQELAKSGKQYNKVAYNKYLEEKKNFEQYGNQNGAEAASKEGYKSFVYVKPKEFVDDLAGDLAKAGGDILDYNVITPKDGNIGEWYTEPKKEDVEATKKLKYQQHGDQLMQMAQENGWNEKQLDEYVTHNISRGFKKQYSNGDANAKFRNYMDSEQLKLHRAKAAQESAVNPNYKPWDYFKDPKTTAGTFQVDDIKEIWNDKPQELLYGNSGEKIDVSDIPINYTGGFYKQRGIPFFIGKLNIPLDVAEKRGIYSEPFGPDLGRTGKINSGFVKKARIKEGVDKDGKSMKYVEVDYDLAVNPDDKLAQDKMNAMILPSKFFEEGGNPYRPKTNPQGATVGSLVTDKKTGTQYRAVDGGWEVVK